MLGTNDNRPSNNGVTAKLYLYNRLVSCISPHMWLRLIRTLSIELIQTSQGQ